MNNFISGPDGTVPVKLLLHLINLFLSAIVALIAWKEYHRSRSTFNHSLVLGFTCIFLQSGVMSFAYSWSLSTGMGMPEAVMPMVDHLVKVVWTSLFVYALIVTNPSHWFVYRYFLIGNVIVLVLFTTIIWLFWLQYLYVAPPGGKQFAFFWGELIYEVWVATLIVIGFYAARCTSLLRKRLLFLSIALLMSREIIHIGNIVVSHNTILWAYVVEKLLLSAFILVLIPVIRQTRGADGSRKCGPGEFAGCGTSLDGNRGQ